jgi:hypothetical protein
MQTLFAGEQLAVDGRYWVDLTGSFGTRAGHHCHLVNIRGKNYRVRGHTDLYRALQPEVQAADTVSRTRRSKAAGH